MLQKIENFCVFLKGNNRKQRSIWLGKDKKKETRGGEEEEAGWLQKMTYVGSSPLMP